LNKKSKLDLQEIEDEDEEQREFIKPIEVIKPTTTNTAKRTSYICCRKTTKGTMCNNKLKSQAYKNTDYCWIHKTNKINPF
jgi:hypothetical protein